MRFVRAAVPALSIGLLTVLAALPWGLPTDIRLLAPMVPLAAIHYWAVRGDARLPLWVAFLSGLMLDVLMVAPLGFWAFIYVSGFAVSQQLSMHCPDWKVARWGAFALMAGLAAGAAWGVMSLYYFQYANWRHLVFAAGAAVFLYPLLAGVLAAIDSVGRVRDADGSRIHVSYS